MRKIVHISLISIILIEAILGKEFTLFLIFLIALIYTIAEICRINKISFPIIQDITLMCTEQKNLNRFVMRPIYTAIGIFLLLLFFPKTSFYLGTIAVIIGDGFAGLVGRRFGRNKIFYSKEKTIEGSLACLVTTFLFSIFFTNPLFALIIAIITTFIESIPMKEENLILSLSVGIASLFLI